LAKNMAAATAQELAEPWHIQLHAVISAGDFTSVFIGQVTGHHELVAVKAYQSAALTDGDRGNRLSQQVLREQCAMDMMLGAPHPFVTRKCFAVHDAARLFVGMELVGGGDLMALMQTMGPIGTAWARFYAAEITLALGHVHSFDLFYRDLKPENVLIAFDGHVKLCDFNSCVMLRGRVGSTPPPEHTCSLCGTPEYMSWEMVLGRPSCEMSDMWSLGVLICEILAGVTPFAAADGTVNSLVRNIVDPTLTIPDHPNIDALSEDIIRALLAQNASERLGARPHGYRAVLEHPWFGGIDEAAVLRKEVPAPWVPHMAVGAAHAAGPSGDPLQAHAQGRAIAAVTRCPWEDDDEQLVPCLAAAFAQEAVVSLHTGNAPPAELPAPGA